MNDAIEQPPMKKGLSGTALRVATVVPLIPIIIWMMFVGPRWVWQTFILAAIAIGGYELMAMKVPSSRGLRSWGSMTAVLFAYTLMFTTTASAVYGAVLIIILGAMAWSLLQDDPLHNASVRVGWLLGTPVYVGGTLAAVALVRDFDPTGAWVLLTMVLAWGSDTSAYFVGRKFGKTKLAPRISPKKTLEGSAGGLAASVVGAVIMSFFLPGLGPIDAIALGILAGAAGQAGDLLISVLKRSSGVKDSGGILPGHGGILDRADALAFTAPATWAYGHFIAGF
ncbi:MAG: phosphatidate cytidylyltransferase [Myxococcales bacterium]|nr:phosphatidate cytidylyltransferase [Myxococcales bacterium]